MIKQVNTWLGQKIESLSEAELCALFEEIAGFRRTGLLKGNHLRTLAREFSDNVSHSHMDLRIVEDEVLFEISRRFYNQHAKKEE